MPKVNRKAPTRSTASESRYTLTEFTREFPDDDACLTWLWQTQYPDDLAPCAKCEVERHFKRYATKQQRQSWTCTHCGHHLHPTAGTIFQQSATPLHLWFYAMYLMTSTRGGISAKQIERELGVTYKTAWKICRDIRKLFAEDRTPLSGKVEMDETFLNRSKRHRPGEPKPTSGHARKGERTIWGAVERGGRVVAKHIGSPSMVSIDPLVKAHVLPGSMVFTDEYRTYRNMGQKGYIHKRIKHSAKVYVDGDVHTQTIEGFWSLVKRGISGTYHQVSAKYLQSYLDEYVWRYNRRYKRGHGRPEPRGLFGLLLLRAASRA